MRVEKWVDFGQEVTVEIDARDIAQALEEAFKECEEPLCADDPPKSAAIGYAFSRINEFLKALTAKQITLLSPEARKIINAFLLDSAKRFQEVDSSPPGSGKD